jgi:hypothetical protein
MKAKFMAVPVVVGILGLGVALTGSTGCTDFPPGSGSSSSSSSGGGGGCADNGTMEKATSFNVGDTVTGKACYDTAVNYYYWKTTTGAPFKSTDRFTVEAKLKGTPEAGTNLRLCLGSDGTWGQCDYASDTLSSGTMTSDTTSYDEMSPVDSADMPQLYIIVDRTVTEGKSLEFEFKLTKNAAQ